jgi:aconitase A
MPDSLVRQILKDHLVEGELKPDSPISLRIDQALLQDATGTMALMQFEELGVPRVKVERAVQYVDHNVVQLDYKNPDDHRMLHALARKHGLHFSRPGNGISHYIHMERFGKPGQTMIGADSHTTQAGCVGMVAIGAGGLDVAVVLGGHPYEITCPEIVEVHLDGTLSRPWAQAKDIILDKIEIPRGPNIKRPPEHTPLGDELKARVATVQPDDISTGDLAPDGVEVMAYRSNVPAIAEFTFRHRDPGFRKRLKEWGSGLIVAGDNYGQGSSREHAALAPLQLGVKAVIAKSFARIHRRNLIAQGIVALTFSDEGDYDKAEVGQCWVLPEIKQQLTDGSETIKAVIEDSGEELSLSHDFSEHEREILVAGGLLSYLRDGDVDRNAE